MQLTNLSQFRELLAGAMAEHNLPASPAGLYDPIRYILSLGGKRLRPCLALMGCQLYGGNPADAVPAALSVELFHNFSLLHDDIMDDAPLRRGKPTVHEKYDTNTAILSGDVMLVEAYKTLAMTQSLVLPSLLDRFNQTAVEVCEGQQHDVDFETRDDVTIAEYIEMIRLKTAVLLGCSLEMGARIASGSPVSDLSAIYAFGEKLGIAFQLQDDYLDSFGNPETFGKTVGGDIAQNKKTYLLIKALELSDKPQRDELENWLATPSSASAESSREKIEAVKAIYRETGAEAATRIEMENYHHQAMALLDQIEQEEAGKAPLRELAEMLLVREA